MYYVKKSLEISAAHNLKLSYESKCEELHGHNWNITIYLKSEELDENGMVMDFTIIKQKIKDKGIENTELAGLLMQMATKAANSANMAELIFKLTGDLQQESQTVNVNVYAQMTDDQLEQERQKILSGNDEIDVTPKPPEIEE
jgi:6-pyruvoyltetrahydropterin/6-carboxytetrahydropterin synthase